MPEESFQEKTEQATPKRKEESRKKGEVAKSRELSSVAILGAGIGYLYFAGKSLFLDLGSAINQALISIPISHKSDSALTDLIAPTFFVYFKMVLPLMIVLVVIAALSNLLQTGIIWSVEPLAPKVSKINPISGMKRIFSKRSLVELAKSITKIVIVGWAAYSVLKDDLNHLIPLIYQENVQIIGTMGQIAFKVVVRCCWVIAVLAILDFFYQKWEHEQKMKMTKQEIKEEFKQTEGDPMIKSRIRSIQRETARRRMMEEVPKADVVVTNPTHFAVAIQYDALQMVAPKIIAKGAERIAHRIKEIAGENDIPIIENKKLAQNLYKLDLGEEVPSQFYKAVAEILAYVYKLKGNKKIGKG